MSTLLKMQKFHPLCSRCIGMYPLQNRWTVLRYLQCYENFSECCTHLILPETALFSPTPTFAKEPFFYVVFQYNLDIIGCYIEAGNNICIPLITDKNCYSDTVIEDYISKIKDELELRIPDKYLKAKGWL